MMRRMVLRPELTPKAQTCLLRRSPSLPPPPPYTPRYGLSGRQFSPPTHQPRNKEPTTRKRRRRCRSCSQCLFARQGGGGCQRENRRNTSPPQSLHPPRNPSSLQVTTCSPSGWHATFQRLVRVRLNLSITVFSVIMGEVSDWNEQVGNKKESEASTATNTRDRRYVILKFWEARFLVLFFLVSGGT